MPHRSATRMAGLGAGLGLWLGWGPRGMWIGLICGLTAAALLLGSRFLRASRRVPMSGRSEVPVTEGA